MSSFRLGDVESPLGPLRLTVGALAEIAQNTGAGSPKALALEIRSMGPETARCLLTALLRPAGQLSEAARLSDSEVAKLMPLCARCVADALTERAGAEP